MTDCASDPGVTLVMPVFNTMGRRDQTGRPLINRMMMSIANQTVRPAQILVLDNQSDDGTVAHLAELAQSDLPLNVAIDKERRPPEEAINVLMQQVESSYVAVVNDDDAIGPTCIAELLKCSKESGSALTYANGRWLGLDGVTEGALVVGRGRRYGTGRSGASDFRRYLRRRNPVPMLFGLWQTPVAQRVFAVRRIDEHSHDLDNMIMATTLGGGEPVSFVNRHLFFYSVREGHRAPPSNPRSGTAGQTFLDLLAGNWAHHIRFSTELLRRIAPTRAYARATLESLPAAVIVSSELRYRLEMGVTWALQLSPASRAEFNAVRDVRRILTASHRHLRHAVPRSGTFDKGERSRLTWEIDLWRRVNGELSRSPSQSSPWRHGQLDVGDEIFALIEALSGSFR